MKKAKRILTVILAICLTFSMVPAVSAAEEIKNPAISFNDWDEYVEEMRRKNYGVNSDTLPEGYDQSVIDAINNNIDNSVPVESGTSLEGAMEAVASSSVATKIEEKLESQSQTRNSANTAIAESFTVDPVADPFNMAAGAGDSVSLATGALTYEKTLLSLPGRNGHDLNISVRYNSDNAVLTKSAYDIEETDGTVNFNQFAVGWSFGFPYIIKREFYGYERINDTLCLPNGGSYEFEEFGGNICQLKNYELDDINLTVEVQPNGTKEYVLAYSNGDVMHFDYTYGNITSYTDRFDNTITYIYEDVDCYQNSFFDYLFAFNTVSQKKHALKMITDSTGRQIIFDYQKSVTDFEKYVSAISIKMDDTVYATVNLKKIKGHDGKVDIVSSIEDAEGNTTAFVYEEEIAHYKQQQDVDDAYAYAGAAYLITQITLPTQGTITYEYEKARRTYLTFLTSNNYAYFSWREVYKVKSRTDSNDDAVWYSYEGDYSGYPYSCIVNGDVQHTDYIYKTTVTQGQVSTIHAFDYMHRKIFEETYSAGTGFGQFPAVGGSTQNVVLNGEVYSVLKTDEYFAIYSYRQASDQSPSVVEPRTFETKYDDFSWADKMDVKTQGGCIYIFLSNGTKIEIYKVDPTDTKNGTALVYELKYSSDTAEYTNTVKYNPEHQSFLVFYWTMGIDTLQCYEYFPQTDMGSNLTFAVNTPQTEAAHLYCMFSNGNTTYFRSGGYMYKFSISSESISITYSTLNTNDNIYAGVMLGNGKTYFINDYKLYQYNFVAGGTGSVTAISENENEDIWNIFAGADNILYYSVNRNIDYDSSYDESEIYCINTDGVTMEPERIHYCIESGVVYSFLATHNGVYLTNNSNYEFFSTTGTRTRFKTDYEYNGYDQMTLYSKTVIQNGNILHQGGESYKYVEGQNAILTHTDILGNRTEYCYGGDCDCIDGHNEELSTYYIPLRTTQYANRGDNAVVTTNTLSADKKKILVSETEYSDALYRTTYTYDDNSANNNETFPGNVMSEKTEYKKHNQNTTSTLNHITYTYDNRDNFVASQTATGILTNTSAFGNKTTVDITTNFTYNDFGQVTCETKVVGQDDTTGDENDDIITSYDYNKNGWQTKVTYPDGTFVATDYDIGNTNKVTTNYNNEYSTADYFDSMGRATKQTKKVGSGSEKTIAQYSYYLGRIESVSDGTKADYYVYDNFDRVKRVNHGNPTGTSYYSQVTYDDLNLKSTVTLSNYQTTTTYYDIAGRVIKEELGTSAKSVTTYTYDYMGNVKTVTDPNGNTTTNNYNDRGQLTQVKNALLQDTKYTYDAFGNVATVTTPGESELFYEYDNAGRLLTTTNALGASEHFAYDTLGNLIAQKDRKGQVTNYTYDNMNRPLSKATGTLSVSYTYDDKLGNVETMTDGTGTTEYDYTYDGMLSGITTPDGESISYSYNDAGYLTSVTDYSGYNYTYTYGGTGDVTGITQKENGTQISNISISYVYPGVFTWWMLRHAETGDSDRNYFYDDKGRVTTVDCGMFDFVGHTTSYVRQYYTYDSAGNITQKTTTTDGTTNYTYDSLNRIASETVGTTSTAYSYDANNNIVQKVTQPDVGPATIKSYTYDGANRMSKETVTFADDTTETTFGYDANGNMLYKLCNNSAEEFAYDAWNRLTEYTSAGGVETTYTYNGDNRRTSKTTGNTTINYYWDRDYVSMETVGNVTNTNFVTPMGIVSRTQDEDYTFLIRDAHGDVVERFTNGERDTYSYDAYGNEKTPDTNDDNPLRYCGEYYDTESGLIYLRNRYYDPDLGRFINEDPIQDGLNWYAYCGNNPVMFVDPLGLDSYIFYLPEWESEAQSDRQDLINMGVAEDEIHLISITSEEDLVNGWNNMGTIEDDNGNEKTVSIDYVIINTHGSPSSLAGEDARGNWWYLDNSEIALLDEKNITKNLVIYGCNAGHLDYKETNPAASFAKKTVGTTIVASDGTVYGKRGGGFYTSKGDKEFHRLRTMVTPYEYRENEGWVMYRYNGKKVTARVANIVLKRLTVQEGCKIAYPRMLSL